MDMRAPTHDGPSYDMTKPDGRMNDVAKEPAKSGAIPQALTSLEKRLEMLCLATEELEETLGPILLPVEKSTATEQDQAQAMIKMSPIAVMIDNLAGLLHLRFLAIEELRQRVDL